METTGYITQASHTGMMFVTLQTEEGDYVRHPKTGVYFHKTFPEYTAELLPPQFD